MSAILLAADRDIKPGPEPEEVLRYWRAKKLRIGFDHRDVWREEHDWAFSAAKIMREDVLEALREELDRAFADGVPFKKFTKDLKPRMQKLGWWAPHEVQDPETGKVVRVDPPRRLATIYETNMRVSRAVGQWDRIQRTKETRPYLLYQVGPSKKHREQHLAWHGLLLPVDDPFWEFGFPINGWGCKCSARSVSEREHKTLVRDGVLGPEPEPELDDEGLPTGHVANQRIPVITKAPDVPLVPWENKRTGEVMLVRAGIDPGFDKRPGEGRRAALGKAPASPPSAPRTPQGAGALAVHESARADVERYRARAEARIAKKGLSLRKRNRPAVVDQTLKEIDPQLRKTQELWTGSLGGGGWYASSHGPIADVGKVLTGSITDAQLKATADYIGASPEQVVQWARARYAITQAALQKRISEGTLGADVDADGFAVLYRGVKHEQGEQLLAARAGRDKEVALELRPVSSWSHKRQVAEYFAGSKGAVIKSRIHISRIFGQYEQEQAAMSIGGDFESEWIVIADENQRLVLSTKDIETRDEGAKKP